MDVEAAHGGFDFSSRVGFWARLTEISDIFRVPVRVPDAGHVLLFSLGTEAYEFGVMIAGSSSAHKQSP